MRIGQAVDIHQLCNGRDLILGGVKIEHEKGLLGHSDADVLTHAIMESVLGALALGDLGKHFLDRGRYEAAVFWYQAALSLPERTDEGGFVERDCCGFLPCIQLCICFDRLGDRRQAEEYNERAGRYRPQSPYYLQNRRYFGHEE